MSAPRTTPGIHPNFNMRDFSADEKTIINIISKDWFLSSSGFPIRVGRSEYKFILIKPVPIFREMFNLEREIICLFSPYTRFEPRTLDAFLQIENSLTDLRAESIARVLISKTDDIELRIQDLVKQNPEQPIIVPFTYSELLGKHDEFLMRNRFRKHFYSRDLFHFLSPLKNELYFFGRSGLVQQIINRHKDSEHTGLFGLRKTGKTSIIYAVERALNAVKMNYVSIDCENPSIHQLRWNELLAEVVKRYHKSIQSKTKLNIAHRYGEKNASSSFEADVLKIYQSKKNQGTLFIFDEIERLSPETGSSSHWRTGDDFVFFWQTIRGFYQRHTGIFTYLLVGTNPSSVEASMIGEHENPLFASIPGQYVPNFSVQETRSMVRKLGRYMGLNFDEIIYSKLTEDLGGHPLLIRQLCSMIHRKCSGDRPITVDKALYRTAKKEFYCFASEYFEMIVAVLERQYPDEYDMLALLANEDEEAFLEFARGSPQLVKHLVGYGIIEGSPSGYVFNIEAVAEFLRNREKFQKLNLTQEEMLDEISVRRNALEKHLRKVMKRQILAQHGKQKGMELIQNSVWDDRRKKIQPLSFSEVFDSASTTLFFTDLIQIIIKNWSLFKNILAMESKEAEFILNQINSKARPDAHAKKIDKDTFSEIRLYFSKIEKPISEFI